MRLMGRLIIRAFFWIAFTVLLWILDGVRALGAVLIRFAERFD